MRTPQERPTWTPALQDRATYNTCMTELLRTKRRNLVLVSAAQREATDVGMRKQGLQR